MVLLWLRAFVLTVVVESILTVPLLREAEPRAWRRVALAFFANLASHPAVWFVFPALGTAPDTTLWISEAWAIASEVAFYVVVLPEASRLRLLGVVTLANGASWGVGVALRATTGWLG
jgi:hypothetical protein